MVQATDDCDLQEDLPQAFRLLDEMNSNVQQVSDLVADMLQRVKVGELSTEYGLDFLEVKYHMLLEYLINLTYIVLKKCSGDTIENDPSIDRLIEIKNVLELIRPIDDKLRYQIDKIVQSATAAEAMHPSVPLSSSSSSFKPNPKNMISQIPDDDDDSSTADSSAESNSEESNSEDKDQEASGSRKKMNRKKIAGALSTKKSTGAVYKPPKLSSVPYDGDESKADRSKRQLERARKRALDSSIIQDLKEEYLDTPIEVSAGSRAQQMLSKVQREKQEYEENYLTRLPVTKAEKHRQRKLTTLGTLGDEITSFGDIGALTGTLSLKSGKRKRKSTPKKVRSGKKRRFV